MAVALWRTQYVQHLCDDHLGWCIVAEVRGLASKVHRVSFSRPVHRTRRESAAPKVDPAHAAGFVGCFKDGNPYWGGRQHALPLLAGDSPDMTVACIASCAHAGPKYTLAGLQPGAAMQSNKRGGLKEKGTSCYCGSEIGKRVMAVSVGLERWVMLKNVCGRAAEIHRSPAEAGAICGEQTLCTISQPPSEPLLEPQALMVLQVHHRRHPPGG